jgi:hypothetical protein
MDPAAVLALTFGWLLGLLSPSITKRIERAYRKSELKRALLAELDELAHRVAILAFFLRDRTGQLDDGKCCKFASTDLVG